MLLIFHINSHLSIAGILLNILPPRSPAARVTGGTISTSTPAKANSHEMTGLRMETKEQYLKGTASAENRPCLKFITGRKTK